MSATRHLSWEEDCAYRRLLDVYYTTEKPLPNDLRAVCRLVSATTESQREAVSIILNEFFKQSESGWICNRADAEILRMLQLQQHQRDRVNKRWIKHDTAVKANDAAVQKNSHAVIPDAIVTMHAVIPPTPTPTPTPKKNTKNTVAVAPAPDGVPVSVWQDWLKIRKAKKLPWTETAWQEIVKEIDKAGISLEKAIRECCARGWGSFREDWYAKKLNGHNGHESYAERDLRLARERVQKWTPGIAERTGEFDGFTIESN